MTDHRSIHDASHQKAQAWKGWRVGQPGGEVTVRHVAPAPDSEPMTQAQGELLAQLCARAKVKFDPGWTKRQANRKIRQLKRRRGR